ncbi:MAG: hypothetical protein AB7H71_09435 [Alphaproteobacteria bacterium]
MSELDEAMTRLAAAVARLEEAASRPRRTEPEPAAPAAIAETVAARLDAALDRLSRLLDPEE